MQTHTLGSIKTTLDIAKTVTAVKQKALLWGGLFQVACGFSGWCLALPEVWHAIKGADVAWPYGVPAGDAAQRCGEGKA